jgi:thiamine biosynthesis lipoprotein
VRLRQAGRILLAVAAIAALTTAPEAAKKKGEGKTGHRHTVSRGRLLMGTICTVVAEGADSGHVSRTVEQAFGDIAALDLALSSWRDDSELANVNRAPSQTRIPLSPDFCRVLQQSLAIAEETDGAFDPTIEPLNRAWDLRGPGRVPDALALNDAKSRVGWRRVRLDASSCAVWFQRDSMGLDLGGIGKGYALDRAEKTLRDAGIERALVNFGGEVLGLSDGASWVVKVAYPQERGRPAVLIALRNGAVSTSGQSERGVQVKTTWYGHILDPVRGTPLATEASVTVVTRSATRADALSTALLVMGREAAEQWTKEHSDIGVLWLEPDERGVRAWRWNLPGATAAPGARVDWKS